MRDERLAGSIVFTAIRKLKACAEESTAQVPEDLKIPYMTTIAVEYLSRIVAASAMTIPKAKRHEWLCLILNKAHLSAAENLEFLEHVNEK